jgi:mannose-6-phosphate isomerase-like protein (cupin superfamily)
MNESLLNAKRPRRAPGAHCARMLRLFALPLALAVPFSAAQAVHPADVQPTTISADAVRWAPAPPSLPAGAQAVALYGSPSKEGPFVLRLKFPAGFTVPPHRHSKDEFVTVISGRFALSVGEQIDAALLKPLPPGSFIHLPAGTPHYARAEVETVVQINGMGPFDVKYVNPKDDPRSQ